MATLLPQYAAGKNAADGSLASASSFADAMKERARRGLTLTKVRV